MVKEDMIKSGDFAGIAALAAKAAALAKAY
jgi:hypothetical protein